MLNVIDYIPSSILEEPFYTVAIQPTYEMGDKAVEMLVARLTDEKTEEYQELILPMKIIVRKSSAALRRKTQHSVKYLERKINMTQANSDLKVW